MPVALITGASRGLGLAVAEALVELDWRLVIDGRDGERLAGVAGRLGGGVVPVAGDIADAAHRDELTKIVDRLGSLDLLINNASWLGPSPLPPLVRYPLDELERLFQVNVFAPLALTQALLGKLNPTSGKIVNVTSDAAVESYEGWGGYGASKAALDRVSGVLGVEEGSILVYAFDPGDMRTDMHQEAYPGEDISDRPEPESVVPALLRLLADAPPSGRYRAADLTAGTEAV
jgi:NAD(P)-dependent dehydrogenase (short-subunit alcohol dehydrogenase family)